jgi:hypothetical protein
MRHAAPRCGRRRFRPRAGATRRAIAPAAPAGLQDDSRRSGSRTRPDSVPRAGYMRCWPASRPQPVRSRSAGPGAAAPRRQPTTSRLAWWRAHHHRLACSRLRIPGTAGAVIGSQTHRGELGRALSGIVVRESSGDRVIDEFGQQPAWSWPLPGAEPPASHGMRPQCCWTPADCCGAPGSARRRGGLPALAECGRPGASGHRTAARFAWSGPPR